MAAANGEAVDRSDDRLGYVADEPVQGVDFEQTARRRPVVTGLGALLLIATGAKRLVARPGQADHPDIGTTPRLFEAVHELVDGACSKRVVPLRAVDRDPRQAVLDLVGHIGEFGHRQPPLIVESETFRSDHIKRLMFLHRWRTLSGVSHIAWGAFCT